MLARWWRADADQREPEIGARPIVTFSELARAARLLDLRARREAQAGFAGAYTSAHHSGGMEFHELAPYSPGDDVRALDWNALARTGHPYVRRYRAERNLSLWIALDASLARAGGAPSIALAAARAASILVAAAIRAGDRAGLAIFDSEVRATYPAARGAGQERRLLAAIAACRGEGSSEPRLLAAVESLLSLSPARSLCALTSEFRDPALLAREPRLLARLRELAARRDLVCVALCDAREDRLPRVGRVRVADPANPEQQIVLDTSSTRVRARFAQAVARRRARLAHTLAGVGAQLLWWPSDCDPLRSWLRFFARRPAEARVALRALPARGAG